VTRRRAAAGAMDVATLARPVALELLSGRAHYERVIAAVREAHTSIWIATANVKELMVEDSRAAPGRRRTIQRGAASPHGQSPWGPHPGDSLRASGGRASYVSILAILDELAARGVELRLLHAELPSRPFRTELAQHPRLVAGGLALARCPRVHMKAVIVDGALLYLGSANWTGAGLGAKGSGRRNFELGIVTDDTELLDRVQAMYEQVWTGGECAACKLRPECPGPLSELRTAAAAAPASPAPPAVAPAPATSRAAAAPASPARPAVAPAPATSRAAAAPASPAPPAVAPAPATSRAAAAAASLAQPAVAPAPATSRAAAAAASPARAAAAPAPATSRAAAPPAVAAPAPATSRAAAPPAVAAPAPATSRAAAPPAVRAARGASASPRRAPGTDRTSGPRRA